MSVYIYPYIRGRFVPELPDFPAGRRASVDGATEDRRRGRRTAAGMWPPRRTAGRPQSPQRAAETAGRLRASRHGITFPPPNPRTVSREDTPTAPLCSESAAGNALHKLPRAKAVVGC
jgi:hypothetical protein